MQQQVCVGGFLQRKSGEFLVVKRSDSDEFLPGMWELPGGGSDHGEDPQAALMREVGEEVGLDVAVGKPLGVHVYFLEKNKEKIQRVEITFLCSFDEAQSVALSFEHSEYKWIAKEQMASFDFSEYMREVIRDALKNI